MDCIAQVRAFSSFSSKYELSVIQLGLLVLQRSWKIVRGGSEKVNCKGWSIRSYTIMILWIIAVLISFCGNRKYIFIICSVG